MLPVYKCCLGKITGTISKSCISEPLAPSPWRHNIQKCHPREEISWAACLGRARSSLYLHSPQCSHTVGTRHIGNADPQAVSCKQMEWNCANWSFHGEICYWWKYACQVLLTCTSAFWGASKWITVTLLLAKSPSVEEEWEFFLKGITDMFDHSRVISNAMSLPYSDQQ